MEHASIQTENKPPNKQRSTGNSFLIIGKNLIGQLSSTLMNYAELIE